MLAWQKLQQLRSVEAPDPAMKRGINKKTALAVKIRHRTCEMEYLVPKHPVYPWVLCKIGRFQNMSQGIVGY